MKPFEFSKSILQKGAVVDVHHHKGKVDVQLPDGRIKEISVHSSLTKKNLEEGDEVVFVFFKNQIRHTAAKVREHVLNKVIYPDDKNYSEVLDLEKKSDSMYEHPVDIALRKKRLARESG